MMVFINGKQADSLTFSLEKMINATIYIGMRKQKKKKKCYTVPSQRAETFVATYATSCLSSSHCAAFVCLQERVEITVIMNLISDALSVVISKTPESV